eukprot:GHVU01061417.1.p1 GENE.GHVU01061417.1~~GHVU01061417.1.p1  ORF type:complete len:148 (+),score=39.08 GHVU01061417.1:224-667(+)
MSEEEEQSNERPAVLLPQSVDAVALLSLVAAAGAAVVTNTVVVVVVVVAAAVAAAGPAMLGLWNQHAEVLPMTDEFGASAHPTHCIMMCKQAGAAYAGMTTDRQCHCGPAYSKGGKAGDVGLTDCHYDSAIKCGGEKKFVVFRAFGE